jgi:hypothetical protein
MHLAEGRFTRMVELSEDRTISWTTAIRMCRASHQRLDAPFG